VRTAAATLAALDAAHGILAVTIGPRELLLVRDGDAVRAIDRRCPHESYPLDRGEVRRGEITCPAHGWRFDLASGSCRTVGADLRSYAVEVRDGTVLVAADVAPTALELELGAEGVLGALELGRPGLAARRTARLLALGETPERVALLLARYGATHADGGLDPEVAVVADVLELVPYLDADAVALLLADVAAGIAERLARAAPRFGPAPATSFAWAGVGVSAALSAAVADCDAETCEALAAGMLAASVPVSEIVAGLAAAAAADPRGPWPLVLLRRAGVLCERLGPAAYVVIPVVAHAVAAPPPRSLALPDDASADGTSALAFATAALAACDPRGEADPATATSLLGCGLALVAAETAGWAWTLVGDRAAPAAAAAAALAGASRGPGGAPPPPSASLGDLAAALAAGPAETSRGLATCIAAAAIAARRDDPALRAAVHRLLVTPRRERLTARVLRGTAPDV
jgi:nitrite reductase/ring-hydroxylating ferredoxin subunit